MNVKLVKLGIDRWAVTVDGKYTGRSIFKVGSRYASGYGARDIVFSTRAEAIAHVSILTSAAAREEFRAVYETSDDGIGRLIILSGVVPNIVFQNVFEGAEAALKNLAKRLGFKTVGSKISG